MPNPPTHDGLCEGVNCSCRARRELAQREHAARVHAAWKADRARRLVIETIPQGPGEARPCVHPRCEPARPALWNFPATREVPNAKGGYGLRACGIHLAAVAEIVRDYHA
jgi:hypothetical protein